MHEAKLLELGDERHNDQSWIIKRFQAVEHEQLVQKYELQALKRAIKLGNSAGQASYLDDPFNIVDDTAIFGSTTSRDDDFSGNISLVDLRHGTGALQSAGLAPIHLRVVDKYGTGALQKPSGHGMNSQNDNGLEALQWQSAMNRDTEHGILFDFDAAAGQENNANEQIASTPATIDYGIDHHAVRFNHAPQTVDPAWLNADNDFAPGNYADLQPQPGTLGLQPERPAMDVTNNLLLLNPSPVQVDDHSDLYRALGLIPSDMNPFNDSDAAAIAPITSNVSAPHNVPSIAVPNAVVANPTAPRAQGRRLNRVRGTIPCAHCMKTFGRTSDLDRHLRVHDANAVRYACQAPGCDKVGNNGYLRPDLLKRHRVKMGH